MKELRGDSLRGVRFRLLGPVTAVVDGHVHSLRRAQTRGLLAYLLLNAGRPVSREALTEALWGGAEPSTARSQVHNAVRTIRRALADLGLPYAIESGSFGYQATVDPACVDAVAFEEVPGQRAVGRGAGRLVAVVGDSRAGPSGNPAGRGQPGRACSGPRPG